VLLLLEEPQRAHVLQQDVRIEDAEHDLLAEHRGHGAGADLHLAAVADDLDAAVLGLRRSAMSMRAIIFAREVTAGMMVRGSLCTVCNTPSMR
jgi:hypothetical protein